MQLNCTSFSANAYFFSTNVLLNFHPHSPVEPEYLPGIQKIQGIVFQQCLSIESGEMPFIIIPSIRLP